MTFSVRQLLTGKKAMEGVTVDLKLTNYAQEAETALTWGLIPCRRGEGAGGDLLLCHRWKRRSGFRNAATR
ncbi:MAG: hypothetical protein ACLTYN_10380 [Dysosmobacter welbionis]